MHELCTFYSTVCASRWTSAHSKIEMPVRINWPMLTATVCPNIGGWIGGYITTKNINWYEVRITRKCIGKTTSLSWYIARKRTLFDWKIITSLSAFSTKSKYKLAETFVGEGRLICANRYMSDSRSGTCYLNRSIHFISLQRDRVFL